MTTFINRCAVYFNRKNKNRHFLLSSQSSIMNKVKHEFKVEMTCEGCSGAVERVLGKLQSQGVSKVDVDLPGQKVYVEATENLGGQQLLESILKTGKPASLISSTPL